MKVFWSFLGLLLIAGAWILLAPEGGDALPSMDAVNTVGRSIDLPMRGGSTPEARDAAKDLHIGKGGREGAMVGEGERSTKGYRCRKERGRGG